MRAFVTHAGVCVKECVTLSFQAHPGTPPVGGDVTGNRYPSVSSSNYYYHSPTGRKGEAVASNIFVTIKISLTKIMIIYKYTYIYNIKEEFF